MGGVAISCDGSSFLGRPSQQHRSTVCRKPRNQACCLRTHAIDLRHIHVLQAEIEAEICLCLQRPLTLLSLQPADTCWYRVMLPRHSPLLIYTRAVYCGEAVPTLHLLSPWSLSNSRGLWRFHLRSRSTTSSQVELKK